MSTLISCPIDACGVPMTLLLEGPDRDVGILSSSLIGVAGMCAHVGALNMCIAAMDGVAFAESVWGRALWAAEHAVLSLEWDAYAQEFAEEAE